MGEAAVGRTIWQAQDTGWWRRQRVVELGQEFGPAGPAVANWLECEAKAQNAGGKVKSGYRAIAHGAFLRGGAEEAERIVAFAVEIGFLRCFEEKTRTFTAMVSAFPADQARGRDTISRAQRRDSTGDSGVEARTDPDKSGSSRTRPGPVGTGENRREEETTPQPPPAGELVVPVVPSGVKWSSSRGCWVGGRERDRVALRVAIANFAAASFPGCRQTTAVKAVQQAMVRGAESHEAVLAHAREWFPTLHAREPVSEVAAA